MFEPAETFVVNLSGATNATITTAQGVGTIVNDEPTPALSIGNATVTEGNAGNVTASFTVSMSPVSSTPVTVSYATANISATAGSDYTAATGTVTFAPGVATQTIAITVTGDTTYEASETFAVNLSGASGATIATAQGIGTIVNDDTAPTLAINSISVTEGNAGTTNAVFTVSLSNPSTTPVTVGLALSNGSATGGGVDYGTAGAGNLQVRRQNLRV